MNIRRQYSLPNCTLVLEGFDDGTSNFAQVLAVLSNVECHFVTSKQMLTGGKVFFDHLVRTVSEYAQGLLSGLEHPDGEAKPEGYMLIEHVESGNVHRLFWQQHLPEENDLPPDEVLLTTTELFDLTEAIDQFLADSLTLPDFVLGLTPLSRRYRLPEQSFAERATPPIMGAGALALTAFALFFIPVPETNRPIEETNNADPTNNTEQTIDTDTDTDTDADTDAETETETETIEELPPAAEISSEELATLVSTAPEIQDDLSLRLIQTFLYRTLDEAWQDRAENEPATTYNLAVIKDGSLVGYQPAEGTARPASFTPLLAQLGYTPLETAIANTESVAQFTVTFDGTELIVNPLSSLQDELSFDTSNIEEYELRELVEKVETEILAQAGEEPVLTEQPLTYSLGVTDDGSIAFFASTNELEEQSVDLTPLPKLINPAAAGIIPDESLIPNKPLTHLKVVFQPDGSVEVSPWAGYR